MTRRAAVPAGDGALFAVGGCRVVYGPEAHGGIVL